MAKSIALGDTVSSFSAFSALKDETTDVQGHLKFFGSFCDVSS